MSIIDRHLPPTHSDSPVTLAAFQSAGDSLRSDRPTLITVPHQVAGPLVVTTGRHGTLRDGVVNRSLHLARTVLRPAAARLVATVDALVLVGAAVYAPSGGWVPRVAFALSGLLMLRHSGLQRSRLTLSVLDDLPTLTMVLLALCGVTTAATLLADGTAPSDAFVAWVLTACCLLVLERFATYAFIRRVRSARLVGHPTLIIGCGKIGAQVASALLDNPEHGLLPLGFLDDSPLLTPDQRPVPLLAGTSDLALVLEQTGATNVIVAFSSLNELELIRTLRTCDRMGVDNFAVPRLFEVYSNGRGGDTIRGIPLVRQRRLSFRSNSWRLKRLLDIVLAVTALVALSPILAVCALAVRFEGGPGIIFRQERIGIDGRAFALLKFRSLKPVDDSESSTMWNISHDDRLGPVGRLLRKLSLDELPQLLNILRGDMSLVGPRPERPHFVDRFTAEHREYLHRHRVPCGLTGWAQVNGLRGDTSIGERARFDNYYIENWSLWLDIKIMLLTVAQVVRMAGG